MVPIVRKTHPPSLLNSDSKICCNQSRQLCKIHKDGGEVGRLTVHLIVLKLVHMKVFACEREGSGFSFSPPFTEQEEKRRQLRFTIDFEKNIKTNNILNKYTNYG